MNALVLRALNELEMTDAPVPDIGEDDLLVKTGAATICTSDLDDIRENPFGLALPVVLGHEAAGTVVRVGRGVTDFGAGDRVATHPVHPCGCCQACRTGTAHLCMEMGHFGINMPGTFAGYYVTRSDRARHLPEHVDFEVAALAEPVCVCLEALAQANLKPEQDLLIIGDGPFGVLMALLAEHFNLNRVVIAGFHDFRLSHAGHATRVNTAGAADPVSALLASNGGREFDAAILAAASAGALKTGLACLRRRGRLVVFATLAGETPVDLSLVQFKELEIAGACNDDNRLDDAISFLGREHEGLSRLITHRFPLESYEDAFAVVTRQQDRCLKVALIP